jgi:hypothetical protein
LRRWEGEKVRKSKTGGWGGMEGGRRNVECGIKKGWGALERGGTARYRMPGVEKSGNWVRGMGRDGRRKSEFGRN